MNLDKMKRISIVNCLFSALIGWLSLEIAKAQPYPLPADLANGLVEWLPFDGDVNDASGNGNNGVLINGSFVPDRFGTPGDALHFPGSASQQLVVQDSPSLHTPVMTAALWFRSGAVTEQQLVFKGVYSTSNPTPQWSVFIDTLLGSTPALGFAIKRNGSLYYMRSTNILHLTNQWQFAAATWDGTNQILYLDGVEVGRSDSAPKGGIDADPPSDQLVFAHANTTPYALSGDIDDFKLYDRVLAADEIGALFQLGGNPSQATATAQTDNGFVVGITVTSGGRGYTNDPAVTLVGGGGTGAQAIAFVTNGVVESIEVEAAGSGYTNAPFVQIGAPPAQQPPPPPPYVLPSELQEGLVEWLPFDGNVLDATPNGNNGMLTDGSFTADRFGQDADALHFSGLADQHLTVQDSPSLHTPMMTAAFWFRSGVITEQQLVFKGIFSPVNGTPQWSVFIDTLLRGTPALGFAIKRNGVLYYMLSTNTLYLTNQWQFAAASWDGTNQVLYLNGVEAGRSGAAPKGAIDADPPADQLVFAHANTSPYLLAGDLDDFKLYNRALSPNEINVLYQLGGGAQASATARVDGGFVVGVTVTNPGYGYTNVPTVTLVGGGGTGAQAVAIVTNGMIESIIVENAGSGYTSAPVVQITPPEPLPPASLSIAVKTVEITLHVNIGRTYVLESSVDMRNWVQVGQTILAASASITQDVDVSQSQTFFRVRDVTQP